MGEWLNMVLLQVVLTLSCYDASHWSCLVSPNLFRVLASTPTEPAIFRTGTMLAACHLRAENAGTHDRSFTRARTLPISQLGHLQLEGA
jgi:hypothetical protein